MSNAAYHREYRKKNLAVVQENERRYRENNKDKVLDSRRAWKDKNREKIKEYQRSYYLKNKPREREKARARYKKEVAYAHTLVKRAIEKGELVRGPCVICGEAKSEGHHEDYTKPLEVIWLCKKHHRQLHAKEEAL